MSSRRKLLGKGFPRSDIGIAGQSPNTASHPAPLPALTRRAAVPSLAASRTGIGAGERRVRYGPNPAVTRFLSRNPISHVMNSCGPTFRARLGPRGSDWKTLGQALRDRSRLVPFQLFPSILLDHRHPRRQSSHRYVASVDLVGTALAAKGFTHGACDLNRRMPPAKRPFRKAAWTLVGPRPRLKLIS